MELAKAEWIIDALFGTGLEGPVRPPLDRVIKAINAGPGEVFAVDIPSGLNDDTGEPMGAAILVQPVIPRPSWLQKRDLSIRELRHWLGKVHVIDVSEHREVCFLI